MTGFFDRLVLRAHGVAATAPAVAPVAAPNQLSDGDVVDAPLEGRSQAVAPPSALGPPTPPVGSPAMERSPKVDTAAEAAPMPVDRQPSPEKLSIGGAVDKEADLAKPVQAAVPVAVVEQQGPQTAPAGSPVAPPAVTGPPAPSHGLLQRFIERLVVDNAAADAAPTETPARAPVAASAPPPVSIGHIEIFVAPPPAPPVARAPISAGRRSQGFAGYAGVRCGLER